MQGQLLLCNFVPQIEHLHVGTWCSLCVLTATTNRIRITFFKIYLLTILEILEIYYPDPDDPDDERYIYKQTWTGNANSVTIHAAVYGIRSITFTIEEAAGELARAFVLNLGDDEANGILTLTADQPVPAGARQHSVWDEDEEEW